MSQVFVRFQNGDARWLSEGVAARLNGRLRQKLDEIPEPIDEDDVGDAVLGVLRDDELPELRMWLRQNRG